MRALDLILLKREGQRLDRESIRFLIREYTAGRIPDYQMAAFCMAVLFRSMDEEETFDLTMAMADSGKRVSFPGAHGFVGDKHSTGGVGDKVSLVLLPMLASCGISIGKLSGRGLGHTGGTIDKLEAIPGFRAHFSLREFSRRVERVGLAVVESSAEIAPADRKLYELRDATGTVESLPLIVASILSKKLAVHSDGLVLDVKAGSGATVRSMDEARTLARWLVRVAQRAGRRASALLTDMSQPLGLMVGNELELREAVETLQGRGPADLLAICLELGSELLRMSDRKLSSAQAKARLTRTIENGAAFEKLIAMAKSQGGDVHVLENLDRLPRARKRLAVRALRSGYVRTLDARGIGEAAHALGAGRSRKGEKIDFAVGVELVKKVGDSVQRGQTLAILHANAADSLPIARAKTAEAFILGDSRPKPTTLVLARVR